MVWTFVRGHACRLVAALLSVLLAGVWRPVHAGILPSSGQEESWTPPLAWLAPTLLVTLLLCGVLAWLRRKRAGSSRPFWLGWLPQMPAEGTLKITGMKRLTPRVSLQVVEWEGGRLLIAVGDHFCARLDVQVASSVKPHPHEGQS